jgi:hypothetical protein
VERRSPAVVCWFGLVVLGSQNLATESKLVLPVLMAMPWLALGARVERDGDLASSRRKWVLRGLVALTILEVASWDASIFALGVLSPLIALVVYIAAGPSLSFEDDAVRRHS